MGNIGSATISFITLCITRTLVKAFGFAGAHPTLWADAFYLSIAAVAGQFFIYGQVEEFGALVFAATMNVRQVVSIIVSYAKYGHSITMLQIVGLCIIFGALFYKSFSGLMAPSKEKQPLLEKKEEVSAPPEFSPAPKV